MGVRGLLEWWKQERHNDRHGTHNGRLHAWPWLYKHWHCYKMAEITLTSLSNCSPLLTFICIPKAYSLVFKTRMLMGGNRHSNMDDTSTHIILKQSDCIPPNAALGSTFTSEPEATGRDRMHLR